MASVDVAVTMVVKAEVYVKGDGDGRFRGSSGNDDDECRGNSKCDERKYTRIPLLCCQVLGASVQGSHYRGRGWIRCTNRETRYGGVDGKRNGKSSGDGNDRCSGKDTGDL